MYKIYYLLLFIVYRWITPTKSLIICTHVNRVNGDPADLYDQNLRDLENSLGRQMTEKIKSLSSVMRELKVVMSKWFLFYKPVPTKNRIV